MEVETVVAESSAAAAAEPKFTQFDGWDEEGTPVVSKKAEAGNQNKPKKAEPAAADASKETESEDEPEAEAGKKPTQETHRKPGAEARIKELAARAKQLERELEEARKPKETKADSSTAKAAEEKPATESATRPKPTQADKGADGKAKYASYEEWVEDLADWKAEQRLATQQREAQTAQMFEKVKQQLTEARERYEDFDSKANPVHQELMKPGISREVFAVINESPVLPDLLYTIGGTEATKADFLDACRNNPGKALRVALLMEQEIVKELGKGKGAAAQDGKAEAATTTPKPRAPKPPAEVGGRGAPGEDALMAAAKTGDFRSFDAEQTRRAIASRR